MVSLNTFKPICNYKFELGLDIVIYKMCLTVTKCKVGCLKKIKQFLQSQMEAKKWSLKKN
jgi:hypothetical protein